MAVYFAVKWSDELLSRLHSLFKTVPDRIGSGRIRVQYLESAVESTSG
jgi:hypothetical protein